VHERDDEPAHERLAREDEERLAFLGGKSPRRKPTSVFVNIWMPHVP